jgi:hypothetical protein
VRAKQKYLTANPGKSNEVSQLASGQAWTVNPQVAGSSPARGASIYKGLGPTDLIFQRLSFLYC